MNKISLVIISLISVILFLYPVSASELFGFIVVNTTPVAGEIFIDDVKVGVGNYTGKLPVGLHNISFGNVSGYRKPDNITVEIKENETIVVSGIYTKIKKYTLRVITNREDARIIVNGNEYIGSFVGEFEENTTIKLIFKDVKEGLIRYIPEKYSVDVLLDNNKTIIINYTKAPTAIIRVKTIEIENWEDIHGIIHVLIDGKRVLDCVGSCEFECDVNMTPVILFDNSSEEYDAGMPKYIPINRSIKIENLKSNEIREVIGKYMKARYPPKIRIISPKNGTIVDPYKKVKLVAMVGDVDGYVDKVLWFVDGEFVNSGIITNCTIKSPGYHLIEVKAIDNDGLSSNDSVKIFVKKLKYTLRVITNREDARIIVNGNEYIGSFVGEFEEGTRVLVILYDIVKGLTRYIPDKNRIEIIMDSNKTINVSYKKAPSATVLIKTVNENYEPINGVIIVFANHTKIKECIGTCKINCSIGIPLDIKFEPSIEAYEKGKPKYMPTEKLKRILVKNDQEIVVKYVRVKYPPIVKIIAPENGTAIFSDESIRLIASSRDLDGNVAVLYWELDGKIIGRDNNLVVKLKDAGKHILKVLAIDDDGLTAEDTVIIYVNSKPVIEIEPEKTYIFLGKDKTVKLEITYRAPFRKPPVIIDIENIEYDKNLMKIEGDLVPVTVSNGLPVKQELLIKPTMPGECRVKLKGYFWFENNPDKRYYIEVESPKLIIRRGSIVTPTPTPERPIPGFDALIAIASVVTVVYYIKKRKL